MFTDGCATCKIVRAKGVPPLKPRWRSAYPVGVIVTRYQRRSMAEKKNKDKVVAFRLSQSDFSQFEEKLASSNMKKSAFFREVFLNANVNLTVKSTPSKDLARLTFLFNKSSNNLNQIAHQLNSAYVAGKVSSSLYTSVNNALVDIRQLLLSGIDDVD